MSTRTANPRVTPLFIDRWSPRSFDESEIPQEDLDTIFEAAGLAPSAFNYQPWRFLYARRGDANWERFLSLLIPFNASWAKDAAVLVYIVSDTLMRQEDKETDLRSHSFDAGAAWAQMALQATALGYHAHAMVGIEFDKARAELDVPDGYEIEAAVAIGTRAPAERLPEGLREREAPSPRKPVGEVAIAGNFR
ncbi:MAG TPA: nitroreductase family protein [Novosphingobium sp.]